MRLHILTAVCASSAFVAVPAFAQTPISPNTPPSAQQNSSASNHGTLRQSLMQDLQKAGFTNIKIEPEAFIVHATNSAGQPIVMSVGPDAVTEVTELPASGSSTSGNAAGSGNAKSGSTSK